VYNTSKDQGPTSTWSQRLVKPTDQQWMGHLIFWSPYSTIDRWASPARLHMQAGTELIKHCQSQVDNQIREAYSVDRVVLHCTVQQYLEKLLWLELETAGPFLNHEAGLSGSVDYCGPNWRKKPFFASS